MVFVQRIAVYSSECRVRGAKKDLYELHPCQSIGTLNQGSPLGMRAPFCSAHRTRHHRSAGNERKKHVDISGNFSPRGPRRIAHRNQSMEGARKPLRRNPEAQMRDLFASDAQRGERFTIEAAGFFLTTRKTESPMRRSNCFSILPGRQICNLRSMPCSA